jgi:hypothetical protein
VISEERADKALEYLVGTDKEAAELKGQMLIKEQLCKVARAEAFRKATGSVESRKAEAETSIAVAAADGEFNEATVEYETVRNRRSTAVTIIDMYRTEEASRRQGHV